jgi:hypothetical protein
LGFIIQNPDDIAIKKSLYKALFIPRRCAPVIIKAWIICALLFSIITAIIYFLVAGKN